MKDITLFKKKASLPSQLQKFEHLVTAQCLAAEYVPSMYSLQVKISKISKIFRTYGRKVIKTR